MTIDSNERTSVGIDVGADEPFVIVGNSGQSAHALVFKNTSADHQKLVQKI